MKQVITSLENSLKEAVEKDTTGSFSVTIFKGNELIFSKAYGKADNQHGIKADTSTIYRLGSISKSITSYLMMLLVQQGTIKLDDRVITYLPEIKMLQQDGSDDGGDITFRQLADHTAGLSREPNLASASSGTVDEWESKALSAIPTTMVHSPVGTRHLYSNIGYAILGLAISRAAHKPFIDLVNDQVFKTHGMKDSFYKIPTGYEGRIAAGYHLLASGIYSTYEPAREMDGRGYRVPNGGVFATSNDLARFLMGLTSDQDPLGKKYRETMQTIQFHFKNYVEGYGLGLSIMDKGIRVVGHNGSVSGFNSYMVFDPKSRIGIVILRNTDDAGTFIEPLGNETLTKLVKANK